MVTSGHSIGQPPHCIPKFVSYYSTGGSAK